MTVGAVLGRAARVFSRSRVGRQVAVAAYRATADLAARRLASIPGVHSVYLTGSLAHGDRLDPGQSDIDLVVACDFESVAGELAIIERLRTFQRRASVFGSLFYNLDCLDVREMPFARAFGGAWEMRLDAHGICLAGEPLWTVPVRRPDAEIRHEQLGMALRRWFNTGSRLLDPRTSPADADALRSARRLVADAAMRWTGCALASSDFERRARDARLVLTLELARRGIDACGPREVHALLLPATLEILGAFARDVTAAFHDAFELADGGAVPSGADARAPIPELAALSRVVLGAPFDALVLLRKGVLSSDAVPVVIAGNDDSPEELIRAFVRRACRAESAWASLDGLCRRPVLITQALWSALPLVEPAPFVGALAARPLFQAGRVPSPPFAPDRDGVESLLRARVVERFVLCRGAELRPKMRPDHVSQALAERFALLPALDRALATHSFGTVATGVALSAETRTRLLQEWSARQRGALAKSLTERLGPRP